jgi:hypothetical protein
MLASTLVTSHSSNLLPSHGLMGSKKGDPPLQAKRGSTASSGMPHSNKPGQHRVRRVALDCRTSSPPALEGAPDGLHRMHILADRRVGDTTQVVRQSGTNIIYGYGCLDKSMDFM